MASMLGWDGRKSVKENHWASIVSMNALTVNFEEIICDWGSFINDVKQLRGASDEDLW